MASPSPCCTPGSHGPAAPPQGYVAKGVMQGVDGVQCYVVGGDGRDAIIVGHDIFGLRSGRTQQICDELAESLGVLVVLPVFFEGGCAGGEVTGDAVSRALGGSPGAGFFERAGHWMKAVYHAPALLRGIKAHNWATVAPKVDAVFAMLRQRGVERVGILGFCWGGWLAFRLSCREDVLCGVSAHPSQSQICSMLKEDFSGICEAIRCPQMLLAAREDKPDIKEGGIAERVLSAKPFGSDCVFRTFGEMKHGWVNRGNLEHEAVARDTAEALRLTKDFFRKHLLKIAGTD